MVKFANNVITGFIFYRMEHVKDATNHIVSLVIQMVKFANNVRKCLICYRMEHVKVAKTQIVSFVIQIITANIV